MICAGGEAIGTFGLADRVRVMGQVTNDELIALYSDARALVFPTLYEGFGLPALEAMSSGTPVAASTKSSIPEVVGPATVYFSPDSVDSLMAALCKLLDSPALREKLSREGAARAGRFSWEAAAERTAAFYREAAGDAS